MTTLDTLLTAPDLAGLRLLAGPPDAGPTLRAVVCEGLHELATAPAGAIAVLTRQAASGTEDYQLDIAVREAATAGVVAVVLRLNGEPQIARSLTRLAERGRVAVLLAPADLDAGTLCVAIQREIDAGAVQWVRRLALLRDDLAGLRPRADSLEQVLHAAQRTLTVTPTVQELDADPDPGASADQPATVLQALRGSPAKVLQVDGEYGWLAAALCAGAANRLTEQAEDEQESSLQSIASVLAELLLTARQPPETTVDRARALGIAVDAWHLAGRIEISDYGSYGNADPVTEHELGEEAMRLALQALRRDRSGPWHAAHIGDAITILRTSQNAFDERATTQFHAAVEHAAAAVREHYPRLRLTGGIGRSHEGVDGLRVSASEAAAASPHGGDRITRFDATGLRGMLMGVTASAAARSSVGRLLAPLDSLGQDKAETAVRTLLAYFAARGSCTHAGERLHLHRNAVAYRISNIQELLDTDLDDPDDRFALELACRAWLMNSAGESS